MFPRAHLVSVITTSSRVKEGHSIHEQCDEADNRHFFPCWHYLCVRRPPRANYGLCINAICKHQTRHSINNGVGMIRRDSVATLHQANSLQCIPSTKLSCQAYQRRRKKQLKIKTCLIQKQLEKEFCSLIDAAGG